MAWLSGYGCVTGQGDTVVALWSALTDGTPGAGGDIHFQSRRSGTVRDLLNEKLKQAYKSCPEPSSSRLGVIFASTKGMNEDFIWNPRPEEMAADPLTPVLNDFLRATGLQPGKSLCVSNACSSALGAARLAQSWLARGLDEVLVIAADAATRFVRSGFQSLKLVSETEPPRPFARGRAGFRLGEAAACLLFTREARPGAVHLRPVGLDTEGSAVTRPSHSGESLIRAAMRIPGMPLQAAPDLLIAHGTGTVINDETEDLAYARLFSDNASKPMLTGSKWCTGHTLGASAAIDLILAAECIRRGQAFALPYDTDPSFKCRYLRRGEVLAPRRVMVSSLGFGGMHAAALVEAAQCV